jgi:hypothetical protein
MQPQFLTKALNGNERKRHVPAALPPRDKRLGASQGDSKRLERLQSVTAEQTQDSFQ